MMEEVIVDVEPMGEALEPTEEIDATVERVR